MTSAELADRLDATPSANGWAARCPAHEDARASLSVSEAVDGRTLIKCHAGCESDAIVSAMGLTLADLFSERSGTAERQQSTKYNYFAADGTLAYQAVRFQPKDFRQRRPDGAGGWLWNMAGADRVLYRLPELHGCELGVGVEGEKDADERWRRRQVARSLLAAASGGWRAARHHPARQRPSWPAAR